MKRAIVGLLLVLATSVAFALPTVQQVEAETRAGNYTRAESMMSEVVAAKPGSAKAHYIYAELLARNGNFSKASEEAAKARQIDPKIGFTDPEKFRSFEQTLQRALNPPARTQTSAPTAAPPQAAPSQAVTPARSSASSGIPGWVWPVGLAVVAFFLWKAFSRRRAAGSIGPSGNGGVSPTGYPPSQPPGGGFGGGAPYGAPGGAPYGNPGVAPRAGGGLLGTGLAVAGGVAGGMLLNQVLNQHSDGGAGAAAGAGAGGALGGLVPDSYAATPPDSAASDLENRSVDFGSGGDWDSGGGSIDSGDGGSWD